MRILLTYLVAVACVFSLGHVSAFTTPQRYPTAPRVISHRTFPLRESPAGALYAKKRGSMEPVDHSSRRWKAPSRSTLVGTAVVLSTAFAAFPAISQAVDLSRAVSLADGATTWFSNLSETGFYQAFSLVFVSEIGDKTFFIAGLLAAKFNRLISFVGSMGALAVMTILSVLIGQIFHAVPSGLTEGIPLDDVAAVLAFAFFGIKTLKEALETEEGESAMDEEFAEAEEEVSLFQSGSGAWGAIASIFTLVFAAEFGDRSFLSTIALSAAQNPISVATGGIAAHAVATGIAVSGGSVLAKYISERVIGLIGGTLFLVFAVTTAIGIF